MRKVFLLLIIFPLISSKCAEETIHLTTINKSKYNIILSIKDKKLPINIMYEKKEFYGNLFNIIRKNETNKYIFSQYNLDFYIKPEKEIYTFYFYKIISENALKKELIVQKQYDSVNVPVDFIELSRDADEQKNVVLIYENNKIRFSQDKL